MKIEAMKIKYVDGFQCRQFKIRLDNDNLYLLSMNVDKYEHDRIYYTYSLYDGNCTLFSGNEFSAPNGWEVLELHTVYELLYFLTLRPGDTDKEYFKDYTVKQLEWVNSDDCEEIGIYLSDLE